MVAYELYSSEGPLRARGLTRRDGRGGGDQGGADV